MSFKRWNRTRNNKNTKKRRYYSGECCLMPEVISLSDVRYRASQEGDIPATYPGHQTNRTGTNKVFIDNVKYRSNQNVVWFEDDIAAAPNILFNGRSGLSITGTIRKATDSWEGYGTPTVWAKFRAPYSGQYTMTIEAIDGKPTTSYDGGGNPIDGFVPNVEIWLPYTSDVPTGYGDIEDFPGFAWPPYQFGDFVFDLIAGRTYYMLVYSWSDDGPAEPDEEDGSFVINLSPYAQAL